MDPSELVVVVRLGCPRCEALLETHEQLALDSQLQCGACDHLFSSAEANVPPLQPAPFHADFKSGFGHGVKLDQVLLPSVGLLKQHVPQLLLVSLFVNAVWFAMVGLPADFLIGQWKSILAGQSADLVTFIGAMTATFAVGMLIAPMSAYAMIVMVRLSLQICRYGMFRPVTVGDAMKHARVPFRMLWQVSVLFVGASLILAAIVVGGLLLTLGLALTIDPRSATLIGTLSMGTLLIGCVFMMQWLLWPGLFLIADERASLAIAVRWGIRLARAHRKLSLSLVTVYFLLATLGSLVFYVGQVVTTPIALIPMTLGYLKMTGGECDHR